MKIDFPKVDLHCHFDGSLNIQLSYELAKEDGLIKDMNFETFKEAMEVSKDNKSLDEYLRRFDFPLLLIQSKKNLKHLARQHVIDLKENGLVYAETRFAPQSCTKELTQDEVVEVVLEGIKEGMEETGIKVNVILCLMKINNATFNTKENWETVEVAKKYYGKGVVALDLAGWEGCAPTIVYKPFFDKAKEYNIPFTIHAGESCPSDYVKMAIEMGASRIGHGGQIVYDESAIELVKEKHIPLEMCITSNVQTCNPDAYEKHMFRTLKDKGVWLTINTDNMTVSNTNLDYEYECLEKYMGLTYEEAIECNKNSIQYSFMKETEKEEYLKLLSKYLEKDN